MTGSSATLFVRFRISGTARPAAGSSTSAKTAWFIIARSSVDFPLFRWLSIPAMTWCARAQSPKAVPRFARYLVCIKQQCSTASERNREKLSRVSSNAERSAIPRGERRPRFERSIGCFCGTQGPDARLARWLSAFLRLGGRPRRWYDARNEQSSLRSIDTVLCWLQQAESYYTVTHARGRGATTSLRHQGGSMDDPRQKAGRYLRI